MPTRRPAEASRDAYDRDREAIVAALRAIHDEQGRIDEAQADLYARRVELFRRGRELKPPIPFKQMGTAAGVSEPAVILALRRKDANGGTP